MLRTIFMLAFLPALVYADLKAALAEPDLEKRSELALTNADDAANRARQGWLDGKVEVFREALRETEESVTLSYRSLQETGKPARSRPKHYKRAEKSLRLLLRKLEALENEVGIDDRPLVATSKKHVSDVQDQIVHEIMTRKH